RKALERAGLSLDDIDLFEVNEAFASVAVAVARELGIPDEKLNPVGGAVALGHPIGASGAVLTVKLLHELARRKAHYGLATLCIGGGMGIAALRLGQHVQPEHVRGTIIIIPLLNRPGFFERSIYTNPEDGQNLNRAFPGKVDGTWSERFAHHLLNDVVVHVDRAMDLHAGD